MNITSKAIDRVKARIPPEVLRFAFMKNNKGYGFTPKTIDSQLMDLVIRPMVMVDCNLTGGTEVLISVGQMPSERIDETTYVFRVPKDVTNGQSIMSLLHIVHVDPTKQLQYSLAGALSGNAMLRLTQGITDALAMLPIMSNAALELIAENTVMVKDNIFMPATSFLRCIITHDTNLTKIRPRYYMIFSEMVQRAVEGWIYINTRVDLDEGAMKGGHELGIISSMIDEYRDSYEKYDELIVKWSKVLILNDRESKTRTIRSMIGANR